ncbi:MAG TPA: universal stress protein [Thermodesulfovibrionales bacterium]|jgi:nucleotide-binding universal stress UspA family protein|nr:universal stress protein [Thermodesulfovibrionales bacterium]
MEDIRRILVVSRMTRYCRKAVHYGISLSQKYGAELYVLHVVHDSFIFGRWNLPIPSLEEEYKRALQEAKGELHAIIDLERKKGMDIKEVIKEGKPIEEIFNTVKEEQIDLIIVLAHEESHLEHFLFGRSNDELVRKMPCSVLLVKKEPESGGF